MDQHRTKQQNKSQSDGPHNNIICSTLHYSGDMQLDIGHLYTTRPYIV